MRKKGILLLTALFLPLFNLTFAEQPLIKFVERPDMPSFVGYVENEIIVQFRATEPKVTPFISASGVAETGIQSLDAIAERFLVSGMRSEFIGARPAIVNGKLYDLSRHYVVRFDSDATLEEVIETYRRNPFVESVEPIGIHAVFATPNDGYFGDQWHLNQLNDHDIDAPEAWDIETGDGAIIVAILDTGVRYFHKDLGGSNASYSNPGGADGNMWINWTEKNGTSGVDDDSNGYVDDWVGWDFVDGASSCWSGEDCNTQDNDPRDFNGHGTHCGGNVGAINNNGYATCAASGGWGNGSLQPTGNGVKVMALRIGWSGNYLGQEVGYVRMDFAASAFYYAADNGARITSCSWGSSNSGGIAAAIDYFLGSGGIIFKAAGNSNNESTDYMTARTDIISVAATDSNDCKADFSSYGTWVDISAPGTGIWSSYHSHDYPENDYVASMGGTSMATPLTASVAALIWSQNQSWTASQVEQRLYTSADDIYGLSCNSGYNGKLGAGRINAYNAVYTATPPPNAAFSGSPTSGCPPLTVNFTDESTGDITSWNWHFGDGDSSATPNPSHQYATADDYTVSLTVTGPGGSDTETKINYIHVSACQPPVADFVGNPTSGYAPLTVNFTDQSINDPTEWDWNFGDNTGSGLQDPSHEYSSPGIYTVSLIASNAYGSDTATKVDYITVTEPPQNLMHVNDVIVIKYYFWIFYYAEADVQIVDAEGYPVADATVTGVWSGGYSGTDQFTTDIFGWGYSLTPWRWGNADYQFCVTNVTKTDWTYDEASNVVTCANSNGQSWGTPADIAGINLKEIEEQTGHRLAFNRPNPFNPATEISFYVPQTCHVTVDIYNILGRKVANVLNNTVNTGINSVVWNGGGSVASGIYFYRITFEDGETLTDRMMLLK